MAKKTVLGRGLDALMYDKVDVRENTGYVIDILIENINPNPFQPRLEFDSEHIEELVWPPYSPS